MRGVSVDWVRMRVRDGVDLAEVADLVEVQASLAWRVHFHMAPPREQGWWVEIGNPTAAPSEDERTRYGAAWDGLAARLDVAGDDGDVPATWRFNALGTHRLFPPEWQADALRTWLPGELPVRQWRDYLDAVRAGRYRRYLLDRYLHDMSRHVLAEWRMLTTAAAETAGRTNTWATKPDLVAARTRLAGLPEPLVTAEVPVLSDTRDIDPDQEAAYQALHRDDVQRVRLARELDAALPSRRRQRRYEPIPSFDDYLTDVDDDWCAGLLDWLAAAGDRGEGVLLW